MAKKYANRPEDRLLRRKLWMKIAKYVFNFQGKNKKPFLNKKHFSIQEALQIINPKDSKLRIDDLMPFFPDDEKITECKHHLCDCLNEYHLKILNLKKELKDHSHNSENLRNEIK